MKKIILLALTALGTVITPAVAQHYRTSYFMEGSTIRSNLNPAFRPIRGYVDIPVVGSLSVGFTSNAFAVDDIFYPDGEGGLISILNRNVTYDMFNHCLEGVNNMDIDLRTSIIGFGFHKGKGFFDFGVDLRVEGGLSIPDSMFEFMKKGSGSYNMKNVSLGAEVLGVVSAGYSYKILPELTVGARLNYLGGLGRMKMHYRRLDLTFVKDVWEVSADGVTDVVFAGVEVGEDEDGYMDFGDIDYSISGLAGHGFSVDLGVDYKLLDLVSLSASVLDLGMVKWKEKASVRAVSEANYSFTGFEITGHDVEVGYTGDLEEFLKFRKAAPEKTSSRLRAKILIGAELPLLDDLLSFGVLFMHRKTEYLSRQEVSAALTVRPTDWFTASVSYALDTSKRIGKSGWNSLGVAINFHPSWINFFIGTDYMISRVSKQYVPLGQKVLNYYMGISIPLAKGRY